MTELRSFVWLRVNGALMPQIWFDRIGCEALTPVAERKLEPEEHGLTLDQLTAKYPAPLETV